MKFAKVFQQTLVEDNVPEEWVEAAIQYKALKKCIGQVVDELNMLGLEKNTLKLLLDHIEVNQDETTATNPVVAQYVLRKTKDAEVIPTLKIVIDYDADLTEDYINTSIEVLKKNLEHIVQGSSENEDAEINGDILSPKTSIHQVPNTSGRKYEVWIRLNSDAKFFSMLNQELDNLDKLQANEEEKLIGEIEEVSRTLNYLSSRDSLKKSDIYTWRELFRIFLDSEIYFKYNDIDHKASEKSMVQVKDNLLAYKDSVKKSNLMSQFKNKKSIEAFSKFLQVNDYLLKILQFQSINTTAFGKILKKFDKQTSFNVKARLPKLISQDHIFFTGKSLSQSICYIIQLSLLQIVPQLEDYTCPICLEIAFKPIKLECGHMFCVRCLVKMKREDRLDCPICRMAKAVSTADSRNLDVEAMQLMERMFPKEVKKKLKDREKERYNEVFGENKCIIV